MANIKRFLPDYRGETMINRRYINEKEGMAITQQKAQMSLD
jgi:hypothetical protein